MNSIELDTVSTVVLEFVLLALAVGIVIGVFIGYWSWA